jgi:hypothetical protein
MQIQTKAEKTMSYLFLIRSSFYNRRAQSIDIIRRKGPDRPTVCQFQTPFPRFEIKPQCRQNVAAGPRALPKIGVPVAGEDDMTNAQFLCGIVAVRICVHQRQLIQRLRDHTRPSTIADNMDPPGIGYFSQVLDKYP